MADLLGGVLYESHRMRFLLVELGKGWGNGNSDSGSPAADHPKTAHYTPAGSPLCWAEFSASPREEQGLSGREPRDNKKCRFLVFRVRSRRDLGMYMCIDIETGRRNVRHVRTDFSPTAPACQPDVPKGQLHARKDCKVKD
jgi:hypothetical protein